MKSSPNGARPEGGSREAVEPDPRQWDFEEEHPTHAFIQWKGTDVCMDFWCDCGAEGHFDGDFAYVVKCPACDQEWEMPTFVFPRKRCAATYAGHTARLIEGDDE